MTTLVDADARRRALTDLEASLLVEAGAGTGKTSLLAGRLAMLLAEGTPPSQIAAITFTELAASELAARVRSMIEALLRGEVPRSLREALPERLSSGQSAALEVAAAELDGLTTATIHGFCQELIRGYAVEADIDPGAQVMDRDAAELAFDQVFDRWLERRLDAAASDNDPLAVLARADPRRMADDLRRLARFRRDHRDARPLAPDLTGRPDIDLVDAVETYRRWLNQSPDEPVTAALVRDLEALADFYRDRFARTPDFEALWAMTEPPKLASRLKNGLGLRRPRTATAWRRAGGETDGPRLDAESQAHFDRVEATYAELLGRVAGALVHVLSGELDEVMADYAAHKRAAAVLDFDDLLHLAARLVRTQPGVRSAVAERFCRLLVDEFQDTDRLQCEIVFRLTSDGDAAEWSDLAPRAGALFLVGDPKQAIYRFRGASVETYEIAKAALRRAWPQNIVRVTANFRSRSAILAYVNEAFDTPLSALEQPGYVPLAATRDDRPGLLSVARLPVALPPGVYREDMQDAEAEAVAELCRGLMGRPLVEEGEGRLRAITPGDVALLAPTGTDLWRYERALQQVGLPFASQAGKGLWRRQEAQDILTLARVLADGRDTVAFGALLRGPLVGITDEALLDISEAMAVDEVPARLSVAAPLDKITDPGLRRILGILQPLRRKAHVLSPAQLLGEAIERLGVRPILAMRDPSHASSAQANVDAILTKASRYGVRGLRRFVQDLTLEWREGHRSVEGRPESDGAAIEIVTMHSAKGLEWPVVIPINAMIQTRPPEPFVHRDDDHSLHWRVGGVTPPGLREAMQRDAAAETRERARIWYVTCTRACDLLVIPELGTASDQSWAKVIDLRLGGLPSMTLPGEPGRPVALDEDSPNLQDRAQFEAEAERVAAASPPIRWVRPSDHDTDRLPIEPAVADIVEAEGEPTALPGGRVRGLVLHKLLEEILEGLLAETREAVMTRAATLLDQVERMVRERDVELDPAELAQIILDTLALPDVAALRPRLRVEVAVYGALGDEAAPALMSGRIDALALSEDNEVDVVIDWKSDVRPSPADQAAHQGQLSLYLAATGAPRGALVYLSLGQVLWVEGPVGPTTGA